MSRSFCLTAECNASNFLFRKPTITTEQSDGNSSFSVQVSSPQLMISTCHIEEKCYLINSLDSELSHHLTDLIIKKGRHQNMQHTLISINFFNLKRLRKVDQRQSSVVASDGTSYSRFSSLIQPLRAHRTLRKCISN